jgi:hypothetical protein
VHVRDWLSARDTLSTARNKDNGKPVGVETRLVVSRTSPGKFNTDEAVYAVRYWYTEIVRYYPNGLIGINIRGPKGTTTYEVKDDGEKATQAPGDGAGSVADGDGDAAPVAAGTGEAV